MPRLLATQGHRMRNSWSSTQGDEGLALICRGATCGFFENVDSCAGPGRERVCISNRVLGGASLGEVSASPSLETSGADDL